MPGPWGPDDDYWLALAASLRPAAVVDLGCGTGRLTVALAADGHPVVGVDPDPEMLAAAGARPGHELVTWIAGDAADIATGTADLVLMTSHVAQVFRTDDDWQDALREIRRALRPGGRVAFDMRNHRHRGWEAWNPVDSRRTVLTDAGPVEVWHEVTAVRDGLVSFDTTTRPAGGDHVEVTHEILRFRDELDLRASLARAGFTVEELHGDWDASPARPTCRELIVTASISRHHAPSRVGAGISSEPG